MYGSVTTGDSWRMAGYDGTFQMSEGMGIEFDTIGRDRERWMRDHPSPERCIGSRKQHGLKKVSTVLIPRDLFGVISIFHRPCSEAE